ncbi:unnamed protein product, partial [Iphiclides podalirius]
MPRRGPTAPSLSLTAALRTPPTGIAIFIGDAHKYAGQMTARFYNAMATSSGDLPLPRAASLQPPHAPLTIDRQL